MASYWPPSIFFLFWRVYGLGMTDSPEQLRQLLLVSSGGQSQCRISFTLPAHRASHKIKSAVISIGFFLSNICSLDINRRGVKRTPKKLA